VLDQLERLGDAVTELPIDSAEEDIRNAIVAVSVRIESLRLSVLRVHDRLSIRTVRAKYRKKKSA
jgi:hypothetical protein